MTSVGRCTCSTSQAVVALLPVPVAPSSTTSGSPASSRRVSSAIAAGWSPAGAKSLTTSNRRVERFRSVASRGTDGFAPCGAGGDGVRARSGSPLHGTSALRQDAGTDADSGPSGVRSDASRTASRRTHVALDAHRPPRAGQGARPGGGRRDEGRSTRRCRAVRSRTRCTARGSATSCTRCSSPGRSGCGRARMLLDLTAGRAGPCAPRSASSARACSPRSRPPCRARPTGPSSASPSAPSGSGSCTPRPTT